MSMLFAFPSHPHLFVPFITCKYDQLQLHDGAGGNPFDWPRPAVMKKQLRKVAIEKSYSIKKSNELEDIFTHS